MADEQSAAIPFIFVYGGLMRGCDLHHYMAGATFSGDGWISGTLISLGRYPGLIDGDDKVFGEVYKLNDAAAMLEALDDLEDFDPADPESSVYLRVSRDVHVRDGSVVRAWTYLYNGNARDAQVIAGGDWRQHTV